MSDGARQKVNIADNSVAAKSVLVFEICAATPFYNLCKNGVFALFHIFCNVKFRLKSASLAETDIHIVYVKFKTGRNSLKHDIMLSFGVVNLKFAHINAQRIVVGHIRRVNGKLKRNVRVIRFFITCCLPAGRHFYFVPVFDFAVVIDVTAEIFKIPFAVKQRIRTVVFGYVIRSLLLSVFRYFFGIFIKSHFFLSFFLPFF